ncbi:MAG TPA: hypothetical protein VF251_10835, partial [Pyrinomonadaceae bacterium]
MYESCTHKYVAVNWRQSGLPNQLSNTQITRKPVSSRFIHLIFALLIWSGTAYALDPQKQLSQFGVNVWLTENGLPQNTVHA